MKLQLDRYEFLREEVSYLGHVIAEDVVSSDPGKVKSVEEFPTPKMQGS
jgi:hypothetical protein